MENSSARRPPSRPWEKANVERSYLLVLREDSSTVFKLPSSGEVVVGRSERADLRVDEPGVELEHIRLRRVREETWIEPIAGGPSPLVNGGRLDRPRLLTSGDSITVGQSTLVYRSNAPHTSVLRILDFVHLRQRLAEEIERSWRSRREFTVIAFQFESPPGWTRLREALEGRFRVSDVIGEDGQHRVLSLMPELGRELASMVATRLSKTLGALDPAVRAGVAVYPRDGCTIDTLLAGARTAAAQSERGGVVLASSVFEVHDLGPHKVVVADPSMSRVYSLVRRVAGSELPALITGETGTGKEATAYAIHHWSRRSEGPFVAFSCAALPDNLLESELFGHERGAFTGAVTAKPGLLETGSGGTVFLDEVGELSLAAQAKLLRVLETGKVHRVGDLRERAIDIRIVAATNRDIEREAREGRFRQDLYFRLSGATMWLPPLRDRPRDLSVLAAKFLDAACATAGREPLEIGGAAWSLLALHDWPGNVRELRNLMAYLAATVEGDEVLPRHLTGRVHVPEHPAAKVDASKGQASASAATSAVAAAPAEEPSESTVWRPLDEEVRELEKRRISAALKATGGNQTRAAKLISVPLRTFVNKIKRYGLSSDRGS